MTDHEEYELQYIASQLVALFDDRTELEQALDRIRQLVIAELDSDD